MYCTVLYSYNFPVKVIKWRVIRVLEADPLFEDSQLKT